MAINRDKLEEKLRGNYYADLSNKIWNANWEFRKNGTPVPDHLKDRSADNEFRNDCLEALDIKNNPKASRLYEICWDQGHSCGYSEVWNYLADWVDLIR